MASYVTKGLLVALFFVAVSTANAQKLHVAVYYESLCPDSVRFIVNELYPAYRSLKGYIEVLFVPFGKSSSLNGGKMFTCQHGKSECEGNMIQSCTLNALNGNADASMEYVACQMQFGAEPTGRVCAARVGIDYQEVSQCFHGGLGTQLQLGAEKATHEIAYPYPKFVPTIVYNKRFNQYLQNRSLNDFTGVVCDMIRNAAPVCQGR